MARKKDENTGLDAGVNEMDTMPDSKKGRQSGGTSSEQRGAWTQSGQGNTTQDSDYVPPVRTGNTGGRANEMGGQGEMIDPQVFPGQQSDPDNLDADSAYDSNTGIEEGYSAGGGYAGGPTSGTKYGTGSGRDDMSGDSGDRSAQDYQDNQKGRNDADSQF